MTAAGEEPMMLRVRHGTLRRGRTAVLEAAEFVVPRGSRVALVGVNGAGKTSLMLHLAGAMRSRGAVVSFEVGSASERGGGTPWTAVTPSLAIAPQQPALPPWLTVSDAVRLYGFEPAGLEAAVPGMRLDEFRGTRCSSLSVGQAQAVGFALALAAAADVSLFDEPLAPLDFRRRIAAREALAATTPAELLLFSSQSARDVLDVCDWMIVLHAGRYLYSGSITAADADQLEHQVLRLLDGDVAPAPRLRERLRTEHGPA